MNQTKLNKKNVRDYDLQLKINEKQEEINDNVEKHLAIANSEMGVIKNDIEWLKEAVKLHGTLLWSVLGGIILNLLVAIAFQLWK